MKKIISILLVALMAVSFATVAFAEGETAEKTYTVYFVYNTKDGEQTVKLDAKYGQDLDEIAPKVESYVHPEDKAILVKFDHWKTDYMNGQELYNLPAFVEKDGDVNGIRFVATQLYVDNDLKNNLGDKLDGALDNIGLPDMGEAFEGFGDFFTTIVELVKKWFSLFMFYINSFI